LSLAVCEAVCGREDPAWPAAVALEYLHTYTLVHDDLPSMDDDDLRRGKPTVHVVYGVATAVLAGDALQALAFERLADTAPTPRYDAAALVRALAAAAGSLGVVGGQSEDLRSGGRADEALLAFVHQHKTADLFRACARLGAMCADAEPDTLKAMDAYGNAIGLCFQLTDDLLDAGPQTAAGATPELNCLTVYSRDEARRHAHAHTQRARQALRPLPEARRAPLEALADLLLERSR
jgi:geranylgeranyl pyrophosphate synthase